MQDAVIVSATRTAVGRAPNGALKTVRPDEMAATVIAEALRRAPGVEPSEVEDVILGCAMPEAEQGLNVARIASLRAGVPVSASAVTINRFCSSGLQAIAYAGERIMCGFANAVVAGGTESMSMVPMGGNKVSPNPTLVDSYPDVYLSTGLVAENHARENHISRDEQMRSRSAAINAPSAPSMRGGSPTRSHRSRIASSLRRMATGSMRFAKSPSGWMKDRVATPPHRHSPGYGRRFTRQAPSRRATPRKRATAQAAVLVTSAAFAKEHGLQPMARFVTYATAGVEPERFGIGPVPAIRKALKMAGLSLDQIDLFELNEAFAAQVLACLRELPIDPERLNVNGGAIALGHPLGCTGAKLTASLLYEMRRRQSRYGMVTMCVGGGMGAAGIFERL
jgi:acetyl-CoA acyltransferase